MRSLLADFHVYFQNFTRSCVEILEDVKPRPMVFELVLRIIARPLLCVGGMSGGAKHILWSCRLCFFFAQPHCSVTKDRDTSRHVCVSFKKGLRTTPMCCAKVLRRVVHGRYICAYLFFLTTAPLRLEILETTQPCPMVPIIFPKSSFVGLDVLWKFLDAL